MECTTQSSLINLHPNEYTQGLSYYPFTAHLDRCVRSCNTLDDLSNKACLPNKIEDLNLSGFSMITGINESKSIYHVNVNVNLIVESVIQIKSGITVNVDVSVKIKKNIACAKKLIFGILLHVVVKMVNI